MFHLEFEMINTSTIETGQKKELASQLVINEKSTFLSKFHETLSKWPFHVYLRLPKFQGDWTKIEDIFCFSQLLSQFVFSDQSLTSN